MRSRALAALAALAASVGGVFLGRGLLESMIFLPSRRALVEASALARPVEEVFLEAEDGVRVHAYIVPASSGRPAPPPRRAILLLHGNAGEASSRLHWASALADLRADVLVLDYRGYGKSEGRPSEEGVYLDARAALGGLVARGYPEERVVVVGHSLGGAVAVDLARGRNLAGLVLQSTFSSVSELARAYVGVRLPRFLGDPFASDRKIDDVRSPMLFVHGDRDRIVPMEFGRALFRAARAPREFAVIPGAGHNDLTVVGGADYFARIGRFLDAVAPLTPGSG